MPTTKLLSELEKHIQYHDQLNTAISSKGVDWHLDHIFKAIIGTCSMIKKSNPKDYKWEFNLTRCLIFTFNYIPRGAGKAPRVTTSSDLVSKEVLIEQFKLAKQLLSDLETLPAKSNFRHLYFGLLDLNMTKKFLKIHTKHHLKIIKDILK